MTETQKYQKHRQHSVTKGEKTKHAQTKPVAAKVTFGEIVRKVLTESDDSLAFGVLQKKLVLSLMENKLATDKCAAKKLIKKNMVFRKSDDITDLRVQIRN
jgi:hypothetical protein